MLVKEKVSDFKPCPDGTHLARCSAVIALGTQKPTIATFKATFKVLVSWEVPQELMENGQPYSVSKEYTASLSEKATLRAHLESWRGRKFTPEELKGFALDKLINAPCMVTVTHEKSEKTGNTYARVASVTAPLKGTVIPELTNKPVHYVLEQGRDETYKALPEWIREKLEHCVEWTTTAAPVTHDNSPEPAEVEDTPF